MAGSVNKSRIALLSGKLNQLGALNAHELRLLEELTAAIDNPDYTPRTYGEVFGHDGHINIFGERYPLDLPGLANAPIVFEDFKGPTRKVARALRALERQEQQLSQAIEQFRQRAQRKSLQVMRRQPGAKKEVRSFRQHLTLRELAPFTPGEPHNSLVHSKRGTTLSIGVKLPEVVYRDTGKPAKEVLEYHALQFLDHTQSLVMALGAVMGHDKVSRHLLLDASLSSAGEEDETLKLVQVDDKLTHSVATKQLTFEEMNVRGTLSYQFRVPRSQIDMVLEALQLLEDLPIYRGALGYQYSDTPDTTSAISWLSDELDTELEDDTAAEEADDAADTPSFEW
jgi:hypothetical protein